jgi:hypothetical protein
MEAQGDSGPSGDVLVEALPRAFGVQSQCFSTVKQGLCTASLFSKNQAALLCVFLPAGQKPFG